MPRPPKKLAVEYDETAHKIAYCKKQIYYFTTKPNANPRIEGYYQEELKESKMSKSEKFKKELLILLFKHNAKIEARYDWGGFVTLNATIGNEEVQLPAEIDAHTKII